eukprot:1183439-Prorocentrum_minimum.AAC.4
MLPNWGGWGGCGGAGAHAGRRGEHAAHPPRTVDPRRCGQLVVPARPPAPCEGHARGRRHRRCAAGGQLCDCVTV